MTQVEAQGVACQGCCVQPLYPWPNPWQDSSPVFESLTMPDINGLTTEEKRALGYLAQAWNIFVKLDAKSDYDNQEFRDSIHRCQEMIALRVARRVDRDIWTQYE